MRDLPAGTVTFVFTDIEGSTRLLHELGAERYAESLAAHRRALRRAFTGYGGIEVDTQGDAFFVAFAEARGGLAAAREAQEALAAEPIRVRMGLHTGEPLLTDQGYVGTPGGRPRRAAVARRQEPAPLRRGALRDARDDPRIRARAARGVGRGRDRPAPSRRLLPRVCRVGQHVRGGRLRPSLRHSSSGAGQPQGRDRLGSRSRRDRARAARGGCPRELLGDHRPVRGNGRFEALLAESDGVDPILRARALRCYSGSSHVSGDYERAQGAIEESLGLFRAAGDDQGVAVLLHRLGVTTMVRGGSGARELFEESLELFRRTGSRRGEGEVIGSLGYVAHGEGDLVQALDLFRQSAEIVAPLGFTWWHLNMLGAIAECALELGRIAEAEAAARESLSLAHEIGDRQGTVYGLALLARAAAERDDLARAGRLWGALEAEEERGPVGQWENERETFAARVLGHGGAELDRGLEEGRRLSLDAAEVLD